MPNCEKCGREFKNDLALKIHIGRLHGTKKSAPKKKAGRQAKAAKGALTCATCGRTFSMPAHLARHASVAHGKAGKAKKARKVGRPAGRVMVRRAAPAVGADVAALTIDQLLGLKQQVDVRLADIAKAMRLARIKL